MIPSDFISTSINPTIPESEENSSTLSIEEEEAYLACMAKASLAFQSPNSACFLADSLEEYLKKDPSRQELLVRAQKFVAKVTLTKRKADTDRSNSTADKLLVLQKLSADLELLAKQTGLLDIDKSALLRFFSMLPDDFETDKLFRIFSRDEIFKAFHLFRQIPDEIANLASHPSPELLIRLKKIIAQQSSEEIDRVLCSGFFARPPIALTDILEFFDLLPSLNLLEAELPMLTAHYLSFSVDRAEGLQKLARDVKIILDYLKQPSGRKINKAQNSILSKSRVILFNLICQLPVEADRTILLKIFTLDEILEGAFLKGFSLLRFFIERRYQFPSDPFSNPGQIRSLSSFYSINETVIVYAILAKTNPETRFSFTEVKDWLDIIRGFGQIVPNTLDPGMHLDPDLSIHFEHDDSLHFLRKQLKFLLELKTDNHKKIKLFKFFKKIPSLHVPTILKHIPLDDLLVKIGNPILFVRFAFYTRIVHLDVKRPQIVVTSLFVDIFKHDLFSLTPKYLAFEFPPKTELKLSLCDIPLPPQYAFSVLDCLLSNPWPNKSEHESFFFYFSDIVLTYLDKQGKAANLKEYLRYDQEGNLCGLTKKFIELLTADSTQTPQENGHNFFDQIEYLIYEKLDKKSGKSFGIAHLNAKKSLQNMLGIILDSASRPKFSSLPHVSFVPAGLSFKLPSTYTGEQVDQLLIFFQKNKIECERFSNINETFHGQFFKNEIILYYSSFWIVRRLFLLDDSFPAFEKTTTIYQELAPKWRCPDWFEPRHIVSQQNEGKKVHPDIEATISLHLASCDKELTLQHISWDNEQEIERFMADNYNDNAEVRKYLRHPEKVLPFPLVKFDAKGILIKIAEESKKLANNIQDLCDLEVVGIAEKINGFFYSQQIRVPREKIPVFLARLGISEFPSVIKRYVKQETNYLAYLQTQGKYHIYNPVKMDDPFSTIAESLKQLVPHGQDYQPKLILTKSENLWITLKKTAAPSNAKALSDLSFYLGYPVKERGEEVTIKINHEQILPFLKGVMRLDEPEKIYHQLMQTAPYRSYAVLPQIKEQQMDVLATIARSLGTFDDETKTKLLTVSPEEDPTLNLPLVEADEDGLWIYIPEELDQKLYGPPDEKMPLGEFLKRNWLHNQIGERASDLRDGKTVSFCFFVSKEFLQDFLQEDLSMGELPAQYQNRGRGIISYFNALCDTFVSLWGPPMPYGTMREEGMTLRNPDLILPTNIPKFNVAEIKTRLSDIFIDGGEPVSIKEIKTQLIANILKTYTIAVATKKPTYNHLQIQTYLSAFIVALNDPEISHDRKRAAIENIGVGCSRETCLPGQAGKIATEYNRLMNPNSSDIVEADILNEISNIKEDLLSEILAVAPEKPQDAGEDWTPPEPRAEHYIDETIQIHCASYAKKTWGMGLDQASGKADKDADAYGPGWVTKTHKRLFQEDYTQSHEMTISRVFDKIKFQLDTQGSLLNADLYHERLKTILLKSRLTREALDEKLETLLPFIPGSHLVTITKEAIVLIMVDMGLLNG